MTIQRYYIDERGIAKSDTGEWVRAADVDAVFVPGVAYMPVPRCDRCAHWSPFEDDAQPATVGGIVDKLKADNLWPDKLVLPRLGDCLQVMTDDSKMLTWSNCERGLIETQHNFGCVMFEEKE